MRFFDIYIEMCYFKYIQNPYRIDASRAIHTPLHVLPVQLTPCIVSYYYELGTHTRTHCM